MKLRSLTATGVAKFEKYLAAAAHNGAIAPPTELLSSLEDSSFLADLDVPETSFSTKLDAAIQLAELMAGLDWRQLERDRGLWSWLALWYFDQLVQRDAGGKRRVLAVERYIPSTHYQREYRHLLKGPYRLYRVHGERARVLLHKPLHIWSDLEEQLVGVQEVIQIPGLMAAVDLLYFDHSTGAAKRGATNYKKGGTVRRLRDVLQQLELTYDIFSMDGSSIVGLLPREFERFLPRTELPSNSSGA